MTAPAFLRAFLTDYVRNPVNLIMLVLVPVVFVIVAAAPMADSAKLLGGPGGPAVETATAGWAAAFLAAIAMYFQLRAARAADRRLVLAGLRPAVLVGARLATGLVLALLAAAAALIALALGTGVAHPGRAVLGTVLFAVTYLAIGAVIGALVPDPVNGVVLVLFVWIFDAMFGPVMSSGDQMFARIFPTHFTTLWMVDLPSHHAGRIGDLGWALAWTSGALLIAWIVIRAASGARRPAGVHAAPGSLRDQLAAGLKMGLRAEARNRVLWVLLIVVPAVFVLLVVPTTPDEPETFTLREGGRTVTETFSLREVHPGTMAPIAVGALAVLAGLFVILDAMSADRRLALAGLRPGRLLTARLAVVAIAALVAGGASLAMTATVFDARQWSVYAAAILLIALTYALIGVIIGPLFGRVAGVFVAFVVPFLDLAIEQSPMLHPTPPTWAHALPGYGASRILIDGALTPSFDETGALLLALGWLVLLTIAAALLFRRTASRPQLSKAAAQS